MTPAGRGITAREFAHMPLFSISNKRLEAIDQLNFPAEKALQRLVEANLKVVFNCRLIESEFSTAADHAGRIDTLALSEDKNPVIVEYKKVESSALIIQSLFYLDWIRHHHGDFEIAVQRVLGKSSVVDWADVRVICIAPNYKKFDLHAVQTMGANIELWTYRLFKNDTIYFEETLQKSYLGGSTPIASASHGITKNPVMVAAGKKAALTRSTGTYTFDQHLDGKSKEIRDLAFATREFLMSLDPAMEEAPKKLYIAYRISQNIACMEVHKAKIYLYLKVNPKEHPGPKGISRDVSAIGHFGTGDLEVTLSSSSDLDAAKLTIVSAYQHVGG